MQTKWDYTDASETYNKRPQYSQKVIDGIVSLSNLPKGSSVCDIGAGTGYLSKKLSDKEFKITAIEPNDSMRRKGIASTKTIPSIQWQKATAESTLQKNNLFDLVSFGSSFNVVNRTIALEEANRIAKPKGYFCAIWNHRDLNNFLQIDIEHCIKSHIPNYSYGLRRENQGEFLSKSQLFSTIHELSYSFTVSQKNKDIVNAWKSHQTLMNQAGDKFLKIINDIEKIIYSQDSNRTIVPYSTRCWVAQFKD